MIGMQIPLMLSASQRGANDVFRSLSYKTGRFVPKSTSRIQRKRATLSIQMSAVAHISVSERMEELKKAKKTAFIPFICAGDPDLETTEAAIQYLDEISAAVIEVGIPFSDPLADGPVIHGAATRALKRGTKLNDVLQMLKKLTPTLNTPIVLFTYYNPIRTRGLDLFCEQLREAGVSGLLVPDLLLEYTHEIREACEKQGVELMLLTTPTTPPDRMREIAKYSQGFVYLVSLTGVTGTRTSINDRVPGLIQTLHDVSDKPIAVGFGVSTPEQAKQLQAWGADGVIIGSYLVKALHENGLDKMKTAAKTIKDAIS